MERVDDAIPEAPQRATRVLAADEPPAFTVERADGRSAFLIVCDHAGRRIPRSLGSLGLDEVELGRHIAWDIGARGVGVHLAQLLDAPMIAQTYSRLVIDCNRPLTSPTSITPLSERTEVPGNQHLTGAERAARASEIFAPYHARIDAEIDARTARGQATILVSMHSFTPVFKDFVRPWHIGMLYNRDPRLAHALLALIRADGRFVAGDNEPYSVSDGTDYSVPVHGERRGLPHIEIEVRQDLVETGAGQREWAGHLAGWLVRAVEIAQLA
ncbi:MAG: N-formylglutamate amidohydrolase [Rhodanobacteraceae bacterium]